MISRVFLSLWLILIKRDMKLLLCLIGMILVVEGIPYFAFPDKMKQWMAVAMNTPNRSLRLIALLAMCTGLIMVALFRP